MRSDLLETARAAYADHRWAEAYDGLTAARGQADLAATDLAALADAAWWLGRTDESLTLSEEVYRRHLHGERTPQAAQLAIEIGFLWLLRGEPTLGSGWVARAARLLEDAPPCPAQGYLIYLDVLESLETGAFEQATRLTERMEAIADVHDDPTLCAIALVYRGIIRAKEGHVTDGLALLDEAMLPVRVGAVTPSWAGNLYCQVMELCVELADLRRAREWTDATERWCDQHSNPAMFAGICRVHRAQLLHLQGAWQDAERHATQACHDLADMNVEVVAEGYYQIGEVRRLQQDDAGAEDAYARAHALGRDPQPGLARLHLAQGRSDAADAALRTALLAVYLPLRRAPLLAAQVDIAEVRGDARLATAAAEELRRIADVYGTPGLEATAERASGTAYQVAGAPEQALPVLQKAARRWRELGADYESARTQVRVARCLRSLGDADGAARELEVAAKVFATLGATRDLGELDGAEPAPAPAGLTAREIEVLAHVAAGWTNRRIASGLSISERTVERHLANIFVKLGVSSRTEAAGFAFAHGLAGRGDPSR